MIVRTSLGRLAGALTVLVLGVLAPGPWARADEEVHELLKGFQRSGQYLVSVEGKTLEDVKLYHSRLASTYLILGGPFGGPILISPRTHDVQKADADKMVERDDGNIYFLADVDLEKAGTFEFSRGEVLFTAGGKSGRLSPNPPLIGIHTYDDLVRHTPEFLRESEPLKPAEAAIASLKQRKTEAEVLVVFGSWCPSCRRHLPMILKVEKLLADSKITFRYHGLPRPPAAWRDPAFKATGEKRLPILVVSAGGRRLGAISGGDAAHPEGHLARLLK
jgi:hypothetical protein